MVINLKFCQVALNSSKMLRIKRVLDPSTSSIKDRLNTTLRWVVRGYES